MVSFALLGDKNTTLTWREDTGSKRRRHIYLTHRKLLGLVNYVTNMLELIITISPVLYAMCNAHACRSASGKLLMHYVYF